MANRLVAFDSAGNRVDVTDPGTYNITLLNGQTKLQVFEEIDGCVDVSRPQEFCVGIPSGTPINLADRSLYSDYDAVNDTSALAVTDPTDQAQVDAAIADIQANDPSTCALGTQFTFPAVCDRSTDPNAGYLFATCAGFSAATTGGNAELEATWVMWDVENIGAEPSGDTGILTPTKVVVGTADQIGQVYHTEYNNTTGQVFAGASNMYNYRRTAGAEPFEANDGTQPGGTSGIYRVNRSDVGSVVPTAITQTVPFITVDYAGPNAGPYVGTTTLPGETPSDATANTPNGVRGKQGLGITSMAIDEENNILFVTILGSGGIFAIDGETGVVLDEYYPFIDDQATRGQWITGGEDWRQYVEGIGFKNGQLYFWRGTTNFAPGLHNLAVLSIDELNYENIIYSTPVSAAGIITKTIPSAAELALGPNGNPVPIPSLTQRGSYFIGDDFLDNTQDRTASDFSGLTMHLDFNTDGSYAILSSPTALHQSKVESFTVDGAGNLIPQNIHRWAGNDTQTATENRRNSHASGAAFLANSYAPFDPSSDDPDEWIVVMGNNIVGFTTGDADIDNGYWGIAMVRRSDLAAQQRTPEDGSPAPYKGISISPDEILPDPSGAPAKGALGDVATSGCNVTGAGLIWEVQCDCSAEQQP